MGKIATCTVYKGGVGKTTLSVSMAHLAREKGFITAIVDFDPQCQSTKQFIDPEKAKHCLSASDFFDETDLLKKPVCFLDHRKGKVQADKIKDALLTDVNNTGFAVIPANDLLLSVERMPIESINVFIKKFKKLSKFFDLIICDTPTTKGFGMLAPLMASDYAFSPINPDAFSADGVAEIFEIMQSIKKDKNRNLEFLGLVINRINTHSPLQKDVSDYMKKQLGNKVIEQTIIERSAVSNAAFFRHPVWHKVRSGASRIAAKEVKKTIEILLNKMDLKGA